jgi:hypothetical protein
MFRPIWPLSGIQVTEETAAPLSHCYNSHFKGVRENCPCDLLIKHYTECVWGSGRIDPHFLDLGTCWRWVVSFTPVPLYPGESAPGTHWIRGWVGPRTGLDDVEKRKFLTLPGLGTPTPRSLSPYPVTIPTTLSRLQFKGVNCELF